MFRKALNDALKKCKLMKTYDEALRVTFLNMIGYWDERALFQHHCGSPSLCKMFFRTDDGYCNIDKGRPGSSGMLKDFKGILPLLDQYCPKE